MLIWCCGLTRPVHLVMLQFVPSNVRNCSNFNPLATLLVLDMNLRCPFLGGGICFVPIF